MNYDKIIILDFGSQVSKLIARRIRELEVYSELLPYNTKIENLESAKGIILSGGPASVYSKNSPKVDKKIFQLGIPVLGICYGMQLMAQSMGGKVKPSKTHEYGRTIIQTNQKSIFTGLPNRIPVWMSHGDYVEKVPNNFNIIARSDNGIIAAMLDSNSKLVGTQFHPEVEHTPLGRDIIRNFVINICHARPSWKMEEYIREQVNIIKNQVGQEKVLCALSGGVDSAVVASLVSLAIKDQLTCIFVDQGTLRSGEVSQVLNNFKELGLKIHFVDARSSFLNKLKGVIDPEKKRKIIGNEFIKAFEVETKKLKINFKFLAQGTLYPDIIESAMSKTSADSANKIKTHHNVGGLPAKLNWKLIEPLRELFKDEVREIGVKLGLPNTIVWRQPFPGPGLAIRVMGEVTNEKINLVRQADAIVGQEILSNGFHDNLWQYFAILLNQKTVGVVGDARAYGYTIVVRAVSSSDGMTADYARLPWEILERISTRITNEVKGINRVVYDITSKPPATIEWE